MFDNTIVHIIEAVIGFSTLAVSIIAPIIIIAKDKDTK